MLFVSTIFKVMPAKRFKKITEILHCNDNMKNTPRTDPCHDKLFKVRTMVDKINFNCKKAYTNSNFLAVDESMIPFKGRSALKQYMPMKPVKRGYKVWCLCDSKTGYVNKFDIYCGKSHANEKNQEFGLGEQVVLNLTKDLLQKPVLIAFDNFFY